MVILYIEDDTEDQEIFHDAFTQVSPLGSCYFAGSVAEAFQLFNSQSLLLPDYIFLDLHMPKQNGMVFLKLREENLLIKDIPVIVYSDHIKKEDEMYCLEAGVKCVIKKPNSFQDICTVIRSIINKTHPCTKDIKG